MARSGQNRNDRLQIAWLTPA